MLKSTLSRLRCPKKSHKLRCEGEFELESLKVLLLGARRVEDVWSGTLHCKKCRAQFPILAGIAVLVENVSAYLREHARGVSAVLSDSEVPKAFRRELMNALREIHPEAEWDLESERVAALYLMNHYLSARASESVKWWAPRKGEGSAFVDRWVTEFWDRGPSMQIKKWIEEDPSKHDVIELGCSVGGLARTLGESVHSYLGLDSSFVSIALARHLNLGTPFPHSIKIPEDLLQGPASREIRVPIHEADGNVDFIVADFERAPLVQRSWSLSIAMNVIDMMDQPVELPRIQRSLLKPSGRAIQGCPYIWHEPVARRLRKQLPKSIASSSRAVEWIFEQLEFKVIKTAEHVPWLFFKHVRQVELYSVHLLWAELGS